MNNVRSPQTWSKYTHDPPKQTQILTKMKNRYEQLTLRASALREELHTEIEKMLNDVIKFKIHVQTGLEGYEQFVDEEVSGEYEDLQREQDAEMGGVFEGVEGNAVVGAEMVLS